MQRSAFDLQDASWNSPSETLSPAEREGVQEIQGGPVPEDLFLEAGIVLTVALGAALIVQLVMVGL
jgi:hypothetical protein